MVLVRSSRRLLTANHWRHVLEQLILILLLD